MALFGAHFHTDRIIAVINWFSISVFQLEEAGICN
jgi:hypothetical protein